MRLRVGLRKTSLVDYPGRVAATLFFPGCNLRCPWCHNPELVRPSGGGPGEDGLVDLDSAISLVEGRRALLGGVVLTGGEPTLRDELPEIVSRFRAMLIPVKIDTNGTRPEALALLLADASTRPDYVAMDLKLAPGRYAELAGPRSGTDPRAGSAEGAEVTVVLAEAVARSAAILAASGVAHEFRSLALPGDRFDETDLAALVPLVDDAPWYFAPFRPGNCLEEEWNDRPAGLPADAQRLAAIARSYGKRGEVRSA